MIYKRDLESCSFVCKGCLGGYYLRIKPVDLCLIHRYIVVEGGHCRGSFRIHSGHPAVSRESAVEAFVLGTCIGFCQFCLKLQIFFIIAYQKIALLNIVAFLYKNFSYP